MSREKIIKDCEKNFTNCKKTMDDWYGFVLYNFGNAYEFELNDSSDFDFSFSSTILINKEEMQKSPLFSGISKIFLPFSEKFFNILSKDENSLKKIIERKDIEYVENIIKEVFWSENVSIKEDNKDANLIYKVYDILNWKLEIKIDKDLSNPKNLWIIMISEKIKDFKWISDICIPLFLLFGKEYLEEVKSYLVYIDYFSSLEKNT